jgi:hypothetical protein
VSIGDLVTNGKQLTVPFDARVFAFAHVHMKRNGDTFFEGYCKLLISDGTGPKNGLTEMGSSPVAWAVLPVTYRPVLGEVTVPIAGYSEKPAGTYNVMVQCASNPHGIGSPTAYMTELMAWTVAR